MEGESQFVSSLNDVAVAVQDFRVATADGGEIDDGDIVVLLRRVRELLQMDVIFVGEFSGNSQVLHLADSRYEEDQRIDGLSTQLSDTYCQLMIESRIPQAVADTSQYEALTCLSATQDLQIAAYLSVPVYMNNGEFYGTLCCLSHTTRPELGHRQEKALGEVAQLISESVDRNRTLKQRRNAAPPAQG